MMEIMTEKMVILKFISHAVNIKAMVTEKINNFLQGDFMESAASSVGALQKKKTGKKNIPFMSK